jgi:hypothetical protein
MFVIVMKVRGDLVSYINRSGTTAKLVRWTRFALALDD